MEFEPKTWVGGETVTAAHLNRIEQGIAEAGESGGSGSGGSGGGTMTLTYTAEPAE